MSCPDLGSNLAKMFDQMHKTQESFDEMKNNTSATTITTSSDSESQQFKKICSDCGTNRTPLWRGGPAGPKSLCNACGIRSRKRRRALLGLTNQEIKKSYNNNNNNKCKKATLNTLIDDGSNCGGGGGGSSSGTSEISGNEKMWSDHVIKMEGLTWRKSTAGKNWSRGVVLGEEEQAAVLLMAMAYSSVFGLT